MAESEVKLSEYKRTVTCECGVELDLRTQGLLCVGCRTKFKMQRKGNMAAAWERFHRRHSRPSHSDGPSADIDALAGAIERLADAIEWDRKERGRQTGPSTSLVLPSRLTAEPRRAPAAHHVGGIPVDRLELE